ncbi:DUF4118 domain-containing protein [Geomonas ferrireducens]|uniref:DUF4118 domain-containing protein n=1 Tax=Geomonas ferrireducens TaxID=2570227 RepID=UPI0010A80825|nr:DUF4118 domain-containing protein [Geomonas ferrireducens]
MSSVGSSSHDTPAGRRSVIFRRPPSRGLPGYLAALVLVGVATLVCEQARPYLSPVNMVMAYLLVVVLAALFLGRRPAVVSALLGVLAFDFFFVPPRFSFQIADKEYLLTFLALFTVGVVISSLVARARESLQALQIRERQTAALYQLSRDLTIATDRGAVLEAVVKNIEQSLGGELAVLLPEEGVLAPAAASAGIELDREDLGIAEWTLHSRRTAGRGTGSHNDSAWSFIPLKTLADTLGVLAISLGAAERPESPQLRKFLNAFAAQSALALERVRLIAEAQEAQFFKARENLERALLNSISHDLRTPLAAITGALSAVLDEGEKLPAGSKEELLQTAREEAARLNRFVGNLLDMTRLEAGALQLRLELGDVEDLVGCALSALEQRLEGREIMVRLASELPLVTFDLVLMIQVLVNLLDNALKHTPAGGAVELAATVGEGELLITVSDRGPGVPPQDLERIFEKFYRTPVPEVVGGTGLGLSICKGIVEAHGGTIKAENRKGGGLRVVVALPLASEKKGVDDGS